MVILQRLKVFCCAMLLWNCAEAQPVQTLFNGLGGHGDDVMCMATNIPAKIFVTGSWDGQVSVWDWTNGSKLFSLDAVHQASVEAIAITKDRKYIFTGCNDFNIRMFDGMTGKFIKIIGKHSSNIEAMTVDIMGKFLFTGSDEDSVKIWDLSKGGSLSRSFAVEGHVTTMALTFDGRSLLIGTPKADVFVYDMTGKLVNTLKGHKDAIHAIAVAPNGKYFTTVSNDRSLIIWEPKTFTQVKKIDQIHQLKIRHVSITPDSRFLLTSSNDGSVKIWDQDKGQCVAWVYGTGKNHVATLGMNRNQLFSGGKYPEPGLRMWQVPMDSLYGAPPTKTVKDSSLNNVNTNPSKVGNDPKKDKTTNSSYTAPNNPDKKKEDAKKIETVEPRFQGGIDHLQSVDSVTVTQVPDTSMTNKIPKKKIVPPVQQKKPSTVKPKPNTQGTKKEG